jgi:hypothetical protein
MQLIEPAFGAAEPGLHILGTVEPVEHAEPGGHTAQSPSEAMPLWSLQRPAGHGSAAAAPRWQKLPGVQTSQAVLPGCSWYVPASHTLQVCCFSWSLYVPALQLVAAALPTGQNTPLPHGAQSFSLFITMPSCLVVPPGQGSGADEPCVQ